MTRRERKYLFIINYQCMFINRLKKAADIVQLQIIEEAEARVQNVIDDTNQWIAEQEVKINELVKEHDNAWTANLETIWQEKQALEQKLQTIKQKHKERIRYERQ